MTDTRRRVKLYALNADRQWDDRGTGHVSSSFVDRLKGISLLVRAESDGTLLLESKIQLDTAYQKQQDTLIVWSEGDNFDLALSFQEKAGCDEIWEKICQVQGKDPSVEITQDIVEESEDERFDDMSDSAPPIELPSCELSRLEDINELFSSSLTSPMRKEKLATAIENEGYIRKLLNLFHMCEDLENHDGLHHLYEIFKNIFLLNKNALFEVMFSEDIIFDVVGCLEYDPSQSTPKRHRQYLKQQARFKEAIPIRNKELLSKIHQTFRVQYIQDVVLPTPSVFEDNMLSTLSSFIFFNKVEIVTLLQDDEKFLTELFSLLTDETTPDTKRRDLVLFLKEFCNYSQNLQPQAKEQFYKTLTSLGILSALEITLGIDDPRTKAASIDILTYIVEYSPSVVREYTLQQANTTDEDQMLLNVIMEQMICDTDPELGGAMQLMGVLRILLDPENMLSAINKSEKTDFLNFFYKHSFQIMIAPLLANTAHGEPEKEDYQTVQLLGLILELLSFCVEHHTYHIKNCILNKDLLRRILVLMKSTHKFLVLCALRFMRKLIALKDEFYNRYIIKGNLFAPVIDTFVRNNGRYNLLDSAILEMFEFIKLEDIKTLCTHVVENFGRFLNDIEYVQTFKALKTRYEQHQDKFKDRERTTSLESVPSILRSGRYRRDQRQLEEEEEMWFNEDEDFEDGEAVVPAANTGGATTDNINTNTPPGGHNHLTSSPTKSTKLDAEFDTAIGNNNNNNNNGGQGAPSLLLSGINTTGSEKEIDAQSVDDVATTTVTSSVQVTPSSTIASTPGAGECPPLSPPTSLSITTSSSSSSVVGSGDVGTAAVTVSSTTSVNAINTSTAAAIGKTSSLFKKGLVDYEGDSDEEEEDGEVVSQSPKRQRLS
ncbi:serine/threonine-protein phosphatase 4 regulatory subunit 3A isoform X2 [Chrysoperla carnea]|uniref:serine/threonine-protein phosphatase 4 regulatory subunit 3A isoform X2 n=1 Tax=Chrysoperla carnea TaxID=189513 RepID=UPI001D0753FD|nr:serine/threonine-protein phosphatase 4 regulatory subunit 3A isoform X2 [Chrysoperla carnea]